MNAAADLLVPRRTVEDLEVELLLAGVAERYGYDFRSYSRRDVTRRIRRVVRDLGFASVSSLQERVLRDAALLSRLVETVSLRRTTMFRDADVYRTLRHDVLPRLRTYPFVRIWQPGCGTGEEAYSLAILLHEAGLYDRCRIYATDVSDSLLDRAKAGRLPLSRLRSCEARFETARGSSNC